MLDAYANLYLEDRDRFAALPPTLVALEEAQRVLSRVARSDENVFPRLAREGRKFKVGLCAVTQQPKLIDDELLSQFNTFFILGLADEKDRNILRGSSKQDISDLGPEIQTLMPGEAIVDQPRGAVRAARADLPVRGLPQVGRGALAAAAPALGRVEGVRRVDGAARRARGRAPRAFASRAPA